MDSRHRSRSQKRWQFRYDEAVAQGRVRDADFTTLSQVEVDPVYGPPQARNVPDLSASAGQGSIRSPRGLHATGYRGKPAWTIRQFAGFGNAEQTNERYKMIHAAGPRAFRRFRYAGPS